jgi:hypothetical protein
MSIIFLVLCIVETATSDPERYATNIKNKISEVFFTIGYIKCTERTRTANSLEITSRENGSSLVGYVGSKCRELESSLSVGDYIHVYANLNSSEILGIERNGFSLLSTEEIIANKVQNYNNYNWVYFALCVIFLVAVVENLRSKSRLHTHNKPFKQDK